MKMRPKQAFQPSGKLSVWLVAIAPSSDFVWSSAPETMLGAFCAKPSSAAKCSVRRTYPPVPWRSAGAPNRD